MNFFLAVSFFTAIFFVSGRPFLYIPLLPVSLVTSLFDAPVPFLIGCCLSQPAITLPPHVLVLHLDRGAVEHGHSSKTTEFRGTEQKRDLGLGAGVGAVVLAGDEEAWVDTEKSWKHFIHAIIKKYYKKNKKMPNLSLVWRIMTPLLYRAPSACPCSLYRAAHPLPRRDDSGTVLQVADAPTSPRRQAVAELFEMLATMPAAHAQSPGFYRELTSSPLMPHNLSRIPVSELAYPFSVLHPDSASEDDPSRSLVGSEDHAASDTSQFYINTPEPLLARPYDLSPGSSRYLFSARSRSSSTATSPGLRSPSILSPGLLSPAAAAAAHRLAAGSYSGAFIPRLGEPGPSTGAGLQPGSAPESSPLGQHRQSRRQLHVDLSTSASTTAGADALSPVTPFAGLVALQEQQQQQQQQQQQEPLLSELTLSTGPAPPGSLNPPPPAPPPPPPPAAEPLAGARAHAGDTLVAAPAVIHAREPALHDPIPAPTQPAGLTATSCSRSRPRRRPRGGRDRGRGSG
jgi:hypothetical protein